MDTDTDSVDIMDIMVELIMHQLNTLLDNGVIGVIMVYTDGMVMDGMVTDGMVTDGMVTKVMV